MRKPTALSITGGMGSMLIGAKKLGYDILGNIEWRKYYNPKTFETYFDAPHVLKFEDFPNPIPEDITLCAGHPECFTNPMVKIYTSQGWKNIKDIQIGDLVLSHLGKFRKVTNILRNKLKKGEEIYHISISSKKDSSGKISVTRNHPILTNRGWVPAYSLSKKDSIIFLSKGKCPICGSLMRDDSFIKKSRKYCSPSCAIRGQWKSYSPEERKNQLEKAWDKTKENIKNGKYEYQECPIKSIEISKSNRENPLYNLEVEIDNSYIAKGFVVHNCGGFSYMNHNVKESHKNAMDIPLFVENISKIQPLFFMMDDLPLSLKEAFTMEDYKKMLPNYDLFPEWISNYHYGNLQAYRKRFFMIGSRIDMDFVFVPGERENTAVVRDAISDLPKKDDPKINHEHVNPKDLSQGFKDLEGNKMTNKQVAEAFMKVNPGNNLYYKNKKGEIKKKIGPCRTNWDGYAHVLMGCDNIFHPKTGYPLTIRERARVQGCPDDLFFYGNHVEQIKQTGKFMPVQFTTYFADQVLHHVEKKPFNASGKRMIASNKYIDKAKMDYCEKFGYANQDAVCKQCWLKGKCSLKDFDLLDEK